MEKDHYEDLGVDGWNGSKSNRAGRREMNSPDSGHVQLAGS